jgi:NTE family protein
LITAPFFDKKHIDAVVCSDFFCPMKKFSICILIILLAFSLVAEDKIGLALSGGGARSLAQIGVLKVIDEHNIPIDYISGTSTGAVIGGLYAMGYSGEEIEQIILGMNWQNIFEETVSRGDLYIGEKRWKPMVNYYFALNDQFTPELPVAFLSGNKLINKFFEITYPVSEVRDFDELPIPFKCTAVNILTGELKVFSTGSLHEVMRASMSFPSVMRPFELDEELYIDGGITANFPTETVKDMGADIIIGVKTNSGLRSSEEMITLIDVLDQTINLNITKNISKSVEICDHLIVPTLDDISLLDFKKAEHIIAAGEAAAKEYFSGKHFPNTKSAKRVPGNETVSFSSVKVQGNEYLTSYKVSEYVGIKKGVAYSLEDMSKAFESAYNSQLFTEIYPVVSKKDDNKILTIRVKEKDRKRLGLNLSYNNNNDVVIGVTLNLNNYLQRNSKLLLDVKTGAKNEVNLDYVKNFGRNLGIYYRAFPYVKEFKLYGYNEDHETASSVKSLEAGGTLGFGIFVKDLFVAEAYGYTFHTRSYQHIAEFEEQEFTATGLGVKLFHESLDDFVFPMRGTSFIAKFTTAGKGEYSDEPYSKFYSNLKFLLPIGRRISMRYNFEYGSYFEKREIEYDPFYIGGIDSFLGLKEKERSAPIYKINTFGIRYKFFRNLYADAQLNVLNLGNEDIWFPEENLFNAFGVRLGYKTPFGPIRAAAARDKDGKRYFYFSIGYEFDAFEFSGR